MKFMWRILLILCFSGAYRALAFVGPVTPPLPNFDKRTEALSRGQAVSPEQQQAVARLQSRRPHAQVEFDPVTGGAKVIWSGRHFLTGTNGVGGAVPAAAAATFATSDPERGTKAFLLEYKDLLRHGPEVLDQAPIKQQFVTPHNGLRTTVWQQEVAAIPILGSVLISHLSRRGELVNISDLFLPDPKGAALRGGQNAADPTAALKVSARRAVSIAAGQIEEQVSEEQLQPPQAGANGGPAVSDPTQRQAFRASALKGEAQAKLVWLPLNPATLRLCWDVVLTGRTRGEMYRVLVDVQTGEALVRRCLTEYISEATYRVYTSDSPSPFSPGWDTPNTNQPPLVSRSLVTISALDTNASPDGWIDDGANETLGNNVNAYSDTTGTDRPDLPRPQGSPFRVFDFPLDLSQSPSSYRNAAIVQLFYWCNWMHDRLYELGFDEAAGNFQSNNFGRGGYGNDPLLAEAQDGAGFSNANFATPPDGASPRMRMYLWNSPTPARDGDLDGEIILHEYTHGLSNRRVGGGQGLFAPQSMGMGEGWSDCYSLSLLSEAGDDVDGVYAISAYSMYGFGGLTPNYYFGIRRYPYSTDLSKNPLTFKDIDPTQAAPHTGVPHSTVIGGPPDEVHNMGEVWCVTLWEARANLIRKYGWAVGNQSMLQLLTDAMVITPSNPNFLQGRDAIIQADLLDGGTNQVELWNAFAKRGMGINAVSPSSGTSIGVQESFDVPDDMQITPAPGAAFLSLCGQPVVPSCQVYTLNNTGTNTVNWTAWVTQPWVSVNPTSGSVAPGDSSTFTVCLTASANTLPAGDNGAAVVISNSVSGAADSRPVVFRRTQPVLCFPLDTQPAWAFDGEWAFGPPSGLGGTQYGYPDPAAAATGSNVFGINLNGDYSVAVTEPAYLTAGPFNFSGYTGLSLLFERWLNSDFQPYVYATIEASSDGTNWNPIWDNGTATITDDAWTQVSYDISAVADNQTNVFIRWGHYVASPLAFPYSGWNIDDIEFVATASEQLALAIPPSTNAGAGTLTGMVMAAPPPATDLTVALTSSDPAVASVPAAVTIPAGQSNAAFNLVITDALTGRGTETVLVGARAPGYVAGSASIQVSDIGAVTLHLSLPAATIEGAGTIEGAVSIRDIQTNDLVVELSSSDTTALQVPDSVFLPAGQTTALFVATVVEDILIDPPKVAVVTAHLAGWVDASATVVVQDNKNLNLTVTVPHSVWKNAGPLPNAGSVSISGILPTNLMFSLTSSVPDKLSVPASVMIPSGQVSNTFDLTPIDNFIPDGNQLVTIAASAPGFSNGSAAILVLDNETPPVPSNPVPANLATNVDAATGLAWQTGPFPGGTITYDVYFGTNPTPGPAELLGSTTNQNWTLPLLAPQTTYYWQIVARTAGVAQGPVWQFTTRGVDHFSWDPILSPQFVNQSFAVAVTARDAHETAVSNFTGTVSFRALGAPVAPTNSGAFAGGAWQGSITVSKPAAGVSLIADDGAGHTGTSAPFAVGLTNDISITITGDRDSVPAGVPLTYTLAVSNTGPADATEVTVTNVLPSNAALRSVLPSQGEWQETNGIITAALGVVPGGTNATIIVQVVSTNIGDLLTNVAFVSRAEAEAYLDNNTAVLETLVGLPAVSIVDAALTGEDLGATNLVFAVTLSAPSPDAVSVNYSTTNGSALEGVDYLPTNGVVVLAPGETNALVAVTVLGRVVESNRFFLVALAEPTNAIVGHSPAVGLIQEAATNLPPSVIVQPADQDLAVGGTATFHLLADGTPPLGYQWTFNSADVTGATNSTLVLANVQLSDSGTYAVVVSNAFGTQQSSNAMLLVGEAPALVSQPIGRTARVGETVTFTGTATGTAPLAYQWSKSGSNVPGATDSTLELTNVQLGDAGNYALQVSNLFGWANSSNALLTVGLPPSITIQPTNGAIAVGGMATFEVLAGGSSPLAYQWSFNGTNLLEGTNSVLEVTNVQLTDSGSYAVAVSNPFGLEQSSNALLRVGQPPAITLQPVDQTVRSGASATFAVIATGTAPLNYQWSFGGAGLSDATNSVLVIPDVQFGNVGVYAMHITNEFGSIFSSNAVLNIGPPPDILVQPTNLVVTAGAAATFNVVAGGAGPFGYQWTLDGTNLLSATNSTLVITNAEADDAGTYAVEVSNAFSATDSSNAELVVTLPPVITDQPTNLTVQLGEDAVFVAQADGTAPLAYQWIFGGVTLPGATSNVLVITNVELGDAGSYAVVVTNALGSATSSNALLAIAGKPVFIIQPTNEFVPVGQLATLAVVATGTQPLSYQWSLVGGGSPAYATNSVLIVTNAQNGDKYNVRVSNAPGSVKSTNATLYVGVPPAMVVQPTNEAVVVGSTATLSVVASGTSPLAYQWLFNGLILTNATNSDLVISNAQVSDSGRYRANVSNPFGSARSSTVTLQVGVPPVIIAQPTNLTVPPGAMASFTVGATGTAPLSYQWSLGGTNLPGATTNSLVIPNAQLSDAGSYAVLVSNPFGSAASANAVLTVGIAPAIVLQPSNQLASVGASATFAALANGTPPLAWQWSFNGTNLPGATNNVLVITNAQLSDAGTYAAQVANPLGSDTSSNAVLSVGFPPGISSQPVNQNVVLGATATFQVSASGTPPLQYQWSFEGTLLPTATNDLLTITNAQVSDAGHYTVTVSNAFGMADSSNALLSVGAAAAILVQPTNLAVAVGGTTVFAVLADGTPPLAYQWTFNGTNVLDTTNNVLVITNVQPVDAGTYAVEVSNGFGNDQSSNAVLSVGLAPAIAAQPVDQAVALGGAATFQVTATGTSPLQYQWSFEGMPLPAATNDLLTITSAQAADAGHYAVTVSNAFGIADSSNALLTVGAAAAILVQPTNLAVAVGGTALFAVMAEGTPPLVYQWTYNGTNVLDTTNNVLVITNVQLSDAGTYAVEVSNGLGSEQSSNAVLSVGLPPAIAVEPLDQTVGVGGAATFQVTATGTPPLQYQWSFDGTVLPAATNDLLTITSAQAADAGHYAVTVSNAFGLADSSNALLAVATAPVIVMPPTNLAVAVGGAALFSVVAEGTPPLTYHWTFNDTNVLDTTNSVLVLTNVQLTQSGSYAVEVFNAFGAEQSSNALLSVGVPPSILVQPTNQALVAGGTATFGVVATGTLPLSYQWSQDDTDLADGGRILGANSPDLVISNVMRDDAGLYSILVSNTWGSAISSNAMLTVYEVDHFTWDPVPSPGFIGAPFPVRIRAVDASGNTINLFQGSVVLRSTAGIPIQPPASGAFVQGAWVGSLIVSQAAGGLILVADDGAGHLGYANAINVVSLPSISIVQSGSSVLLSWPIMTSSFAPEKSPDMVSWLPLTSTINLAGGIYQTRVPTTGTAQFFRLRLVSP